MTLNNEFKRCVKQNATVTSCNVLKQGDGKTIPLQAWTDPEGSTRSRFPDFKTVGT